jgi:ribonuclease P protein component
VLKKERRLSSFREVENLTSASTPYFLLKYKREDGISKFGFIVSKKIDKRATVRNKVKRKLNKIVRENLDEIIDGTFLLIAREKSVNEETDKLLEAFREVLKKEKLLK